MGQLVESRQSTVNSLKYKDGWRIEAPAEFRLRLAASMAHVTMKVNRSQWITDEYSNSRSLMARREGMVYIRRILSHAEYDEKEWQKS
jgi:hypothetical protein